MPPVTAQLPSGLSLNPEPLLSRFSFSHFEQLLEMEDFFLGQLNNYVGYYRQEQMTAGDQAPIGILLCTGKNEDMVQYALSGMTNSHIKRGELRSMTVS